MKKHTERYTEAAASESCLQYWTPIHDRDIHARLRAITILKRLDDESIHPNRLKSGRPLRLYVLTGVVSVLCRSYVRGLLSWCWIRPSDKTSWRCSSTAEGVNVYILRNPEQIRKLSGQFPIAWLARLGLPSGDGVYTYSVHTISQPLSESVRSLFIQNSTASSFSIHESWLLSPLQKHLLGLNTKRNAKNWMSKRPRTQMIQLT